MCAKGTKVSIPTAVCHGEGGTAIQRLALDYAPDAGTAS